MEKKSKLKKKSILVNVETKNDFLKVLSAVSG